MILCGAGLHGAFILKRNNDQGNYNLKQISNITS